MNDVFHFRDENIEIANTKKIKTFQISLIFLTFEMSKM